MRIQHNIMAMNAYRNYNTNTSALSKNLEKLSSGYKINRAGDDAAGLAISEKMRAQITGLETAQKNAKDGISLVQTAEGALTEVHDMLNRMTELATQSANGTFDDATDRAQLQKEVVALKDEINRIADSANFNGIQLLDGSLDANGTIGGDNMNITFGTVSGATEAVSQVKPSFNVNLDGLAVKNKATGTGSSSVTISVNVGGVTLNLKASAVTNGSAASLSAFKLTLTGTNAVVSLGGLKYKVSGDGSGLTFTLASGEESKLGNSGVTLNPAYTVSVSMGTNAEMTANIYNTATQVVTVGQPKKDAQVAKAEFELTADMIQNGATIKIGNTTFTIDDETDFQDSAGTTIGIKDLLDSTGKFDPQNLEKVASKITQLGNGDKYFNIGHDGSKIVVTSKSSLQNSDAEAVDSAQKVKDLIQVNTPVRNGQNLTLQIGDTSDSFNQLNVSIQDVHTSSLGIEDIDISTQKGAKDAISVIKDAINNVSNVRGTLGATQNRLDHTMNNLSVMTENIQDAESTIRDTDVADEMMAYTKNNILIQSAQAMLAQANQVPQGVLQLLQ